MRVDHLGTATERHERYLATLERAAGASAYHRGDAYDPRRSNAWRAGYMLAQANGAR